MVLDLRTRDTDGLETIKGLRARFADARMLVLSQMDEAIYAERALRAGALGYVMKDQPQTEVVRAMRTVLRGEVYISTRVGRMAVQRIVEQKRAVETVDLSRVTDRELHVFRAIAAGKGNKQIAGEMNLSVKTIETYREHLKYKLGLDNGPALLEYARNWKRKSEEHRRTSEPSRPTKGRGSDREDRSSGIFRMSAISTNEPAHANL